MGNCKIDLVFNAYNEIDSIETDIKNILKIKENNNKINKIFVIEDGSNDGTSEKLKELSKIYEINLSQSKSRRGYSKALLTGISICESEFVFFSDLGGKFDWNDINKLIEKIPDNDLVIGKRKDRNDQFYRRLLTFLYSKYILFFYGINSSDPDSGFRIYRKKLILEILQDELFNKHLLNSELTIKCMSKNCAYVEVSIKYFKRKGSSRGLPLKTIPNVIISTIKNSFKIRRQKNGK